MDSCGKAAGNGVNRKRNTDKSQQALTAIRMEKSA